MGHAGWLSYFTLIRFLQLYKFINFSLFGKPGANAFNTKDIKLHHLLLRSKHSPSERLHIPTKV